MIRIAEDLGQQVGVKRACEELNVPRSSLYQARQAKRPASPRPRSERALSQTERHTVRDMLNSERFVDSAPRQVYATLLDEKVYLCSWRTMYRILDEFQEIRERRNQLTHPTYSKPELLATGPNQPTVMSSILCK
jgi:putative transposase